MADIHVLDTRSGGQARLVFHYPVPSANNDVGVNYRLALVNSGLGGTTAMTEGTGAGQISSAEKAQIVAGEVFEHAVSFPVESGGTSPAELRATLRALYTKTKGVVLARLQQQLAYFGHTESEV